jgi:hypothetical protein
VNPGNLVVDLHVGLGCVFSLVSTRDVVTACVAVNAASTIFAVDGILAIIAIDGALSSPPGNVSVPESPSFHLRYWRLLLKQLNKRQSLCAYRIWTIS